VADEEARRRRRVRVTAAVLALIALGFYVAFVWWHLGRRA